eukprot:Polyplicarium_translucidae@DN2154_c0_g1_i1.p1
MIPSPLRNHAAIAQRCAARSASGEGPQRHADVSSSTRVSESVAARVSPDAIRKKIERVLADKETFTKSAKASFKQFDKDHSGSLDFDEVRHLIARLCVNLQLPPVDDQTLEAIFQKYDVQGDGNLELEEFAQLYWQLLLRIRDKYYPTKKMRVRRDFFIGRVSLEKDRDITKVFKFVRKLGSGSFGEVHLVQEKSSGLVRVCKIINKDKAALPIEQIEAEIMVLKSLDHPGIIKIFEVYEDYNSIFIIMELCEGGELLDHVVKAQQRGETLTERYVMELMSTLLSTLTYIHGQRIAHKDLKPENVLFQDKSSDSRIKIIDFGLSEMFERAEDVESHNSAGTALYMAPEVFKRRFDYKCDVWSSACIMYLLLTGHLPFTGSSIEEVRYKVCRGEPSYVTQCRRISPVAVDLLKKM